VLELEYGNCLEAVEWFIWVLAIEDGQSSAFFRNLIGPWLSSVDGNRQRPIEFRVWVGGGRKGGWDSEKAAVNVKKHGITFGEAMECFLDPHGLDFADKSHPERLLLIGISRANRILCVVYAERLEGAILRIISARRATGHEKEIYSEDF